MIIMCSVRKSSNFCSRMLEMHVSEAQISNFFLGGGACCQTPRKLVSFFHLCLLQSFYSALLRTY